MFAGYESIQGLITLKMKAVLPFETSESNYLTTTCNNPEDLLPPYENRFKSNEVFHSCVISSR
jgi:hypothetical protein